MRWNRLWIGVTCGVALALSVVAAVDAGTQTAGAQAHGEPADQSAQGPKPPMADSGGRPARGTQLWALVASDGSCKNDKNKSAPNIDCIRTAMAPNCPTAGLCGDYNVDFKWEVDECAWIATPLLNDEGKVKNPAQEARIAVTARVMGDPKRVRVWVFSGAGALTDTSFSLQVLC